MVCVIFEGNLCLSAFSSSSFFFFCVVAAPEFVEIFVYTGFRPLCKPKKMTPKYRNFHLNFEISEISKEEGV